MSDITDLFEGKFGDNPITATEGFIAKEWGNLTSLIDKLPADLKPAAQAVVADTQAVLVDAVEWGGTALSAWLTAQSGGLQTEVINLISGALGGADPTSAAGQTVIQGVQKLLLGIVAHGVGDFVNSISPVPIVPPAS